MFDLILGMTTDEMHGEISFQILVGFSVLSSILFCFFFIHKIGENMINISFVIRLNIF